MNYTILQLANYIKQQQVIAYPTEAVFGLGCDPRSESAVLKLLALKQRTVEKGLILVAPHLDLLLPFIDQHRLSHEHWQRLQAEYDRPMTWLVPKSALAPVFLTGEFDSIAIRLCRHPAVTALCEATQTALTSTSANLSGMPPCRTAQEVRAQFGADFPVLQSAVGGAEKPSEIRDILTNQRIRS
ncbi:tRNA threonylcarbamoyladenosine biosynthesis protein RimN [Testudinibacter sp. TR-2022]|uniref:Sua5/YciO/YrdC/YwlC family protein n=1 Tax=Testudinibacter sp. TR-2022 TaxID=2585029 RepID=UPI00111957F9|nr:Sua5/YciO/YrdC/YwlC family protein [Testudinibacter sp. TR-2022]TNH03143.1 tRNA threonylcarbamoyladenosine biosynthesis protein RimN [Pasteurellaceae bacterium Phil31]TNH10865.1 tRNA threonylcarbamoyladenosine biosynthesis protein RimN [Testudinibacter sp. TR-2022]TNH12236.1 tRNA threonylcarbamoyladenosine biosynthesis protein RimN [Testudinibacter sp. TR-2022]TNH15352.1 tRNA threonylcarbamoyladenosine biosynthesis protein RimN [Testudinibacter sp. TR-2022]TNH17306.1 tRNA threonylcarbamoyla